MLFPALFTYLYLFVCTYASAVVPRQSSNTTTSIDTYIQQVQTVVYAIDQIKLNNSRTACNDNTTEASLNSTGLDGVLGHLLLCEASVGIMIFPNLTQAERETNFVLSALKQTKNGTTSNSRCNALPLKALGEAGIETETVKALVCGGLKSSMTTNSSRPLWGNITTPYGDTASSPTGVGIRVNVSRLAIEPVPSALSPFITTMANAAALTIPISIPLNSSFSTILSPSLADTTFASANIGQSWSANISLSATISTVLAITVTSTTSITTTLPPGTTQVQPLTLTSTASASVRNPRTVTIWEVVYVTAIKPSSTRIPLTAAFSTQLVPVVTVTSTTSITTTALPGTTLPTLTSTASASIQDPRTITIWQVVYVTAIRPSTSLTGTSSTSLRIPLTASFSTQLIPVVTVTSTTSIFTTGSSSLPAVTLTSTASMPRDPRTVTIWQVVYVTAI